MNKKLLPIIAVCLTFIFSLSAHAGVKRYIFNNKNIQLNKNSVSIEKIVGGANSYGLAFNGHVVVIEGNGGQNHNYNALLVFEGNNLFSLNEYLIEVVPDEEDVPTNPADNKVYLVVKNIQRKNNSNIIKTFSDDSQVVGRLSINKLTDKNVTLRLSLKGQGIKMLIDNSAFGGDSETFELLNEKVKIRGKFNIKYINFIT